MTFPTSKVLLFLTLLLVFGNNAVGNFYINLENVDTLKSSLEGAVIEVNKTSVVRTVCVRFLVARTKGAITIFYTPSKDNLVMQITFEEKYGFLRINGKWIIFDIPIPTIPYVYQHLCLSHNGRKYSVVSDGILWYTYKLQEADISTITREVDIQKIAFGPLEYPFFRGTFFLGRVSELNIFSNTFSDKELIEITGDCKKISKGDKVLDWSSVKPSDVFIPENVDIR